VADLIDRIADVAEGRPKIHVHQFIGALRLYAYGLKTRPQISTYFDLQGDEATQATSLANAVDGVTGVAAKVAYCMRIEAVASLIEEHNDTWYHNGDGSLNKTAIITDLGI
jgi:hypothetical protein